jgi:hypothetical protein
MSHSTDKMTAGCRTNTVKCYRFMVSKEFCEEQKIYTNFTKRAERLAQSTILDLYILMIMVTVSKQKYKRLKRGKNL